MVFGGLNFESYKLKIQLDYYYLCADFSKFKMLSPLKNRTYPMNIPIDLDPIQPFSTPRSDIIRLVQVCKKSPPKVRGEFLIN
jgi:hypothetical protein